MSTVLHEPIHNGEFLISEGNNSISREEITLAQGQDYYSGTVLGRITDSGLYTQLKPEAEDGSQVASAILLMGRSAKLDDQPSVSIARLAEVNGQLLVWPDDITQDQTQVAIQQLNKQNIILR